MDPRKRYDAATAHLDPPLAIVDMDALRANARDLVKRALGKPVRVASKSVRCRGVLDQALAMPGFSGIMAYSLPEAIWLSRAGMTDVLVAYPTADRTAIAELASDERALAGVTLMVDCAEHLDLLPEAPIRVCIDIDASWRAYGMRAGARRSPVFSPEQAKSLAGEVAARPHLRLAGLMAYEAQIAGVGDSPPGRPVRARAIRAIQARSRGELARRRAAIVRAVREVAPLEFVNGGGTGSVESTARESAVTEVTAGSGLYQPVLFDHYRAFTGTPAALFALTVVRRPGPGVATLFGGGYVASGPAGADRLPQPYLPDGLRYDPQEGAGEVQTPVLGAAADELRPGDRVWFRHAKAGEMCERFTELHLVEGDQIVATVPTYRGEGKTFG